MSATTNIEWCDSAVNPVMGCDGCELWTPPDGGARHCYAGTLHERYGGKSKGYAPRFLEPTLFPGRMAAAAKWKDLVGTTRPEKPWLDGRPRHVFISDMGDALSAGVPFEFLRDEVIATAWSWPHVGMWLTKQPARMFEFSRWLAGEGIVWPHALWAGASLTDPRRQRERIAHLWSVPAIVRFLSVEPLIADPGKLELDGIALVIVGGESGPKARPCDLAWIRSIVRQCREAGVACFVKQWGSRPLAPYYQVHDWDWRDSNVRAVRCLVNGEPWDEGFQPPSNAVMELRLRDHKGGDTAEWPEDLRVREMPR